MVQVKFGGRMVGEGRPCWIIAEIGGNFLDAPTGRRLVDLAIECGCDCVKLQTFRADTISSRTAMYDMPNVGCTSQWELFRLYELGLEEHRELWNYCREKGVFIFSTPSHMDDVAMLESLGAAAYKIGSDDAVNIPFLVDVAKIGKPILLSTGMCTMDEVRHSVEAILATGNDQLALLHCVTNYPCEASDANLRCIAAMQKEFGLPVGFSDHTIGTAVSLAAVACGAHIVEKHFTYDKNAEGPDHILSADPSEMKALVEGVRAIESALGDGVKQPAPGEAKTRINNRKSVVAACDIPAGMVITPEMLAIKRPGTGIPPAQVESVAGKMAKSAIAADQVITWADLA